MKPYGSDLAWVHDTGFGDFAAGAAPDLLRRLARAGIASGTVVDLGCGSGIWARALTDAGHDVLGIDRSPAMIELARRRSPAARFRVGSFLETSLPPCDAVTSIGECLGYAFDPASGRRSLAGLFRRVHAALRPGGLFVFDLAEPGRGRSRPERHRTGRDWVFLVSTREDVRRRTLTRDIVTFRKQGTSWRRRDESHVLNLYRRAMVEKELRRVGFTVRVVRGYGDLRFPPHLAGYVARKT